MQQAKWKTVKKIEISIREEEDIIETKRKDDVFNGPICHLPTGACTGFDYLKKCGKAVFLALHEYHRAKTLIIQTTSNLLVKTILLTVNLRF